MKYGIHDKVLKEICQYAELYGVKKVLLFGSRARGDYKERSDIDLAASGGNIIRFTLDVQEEINTLLMFDVVNLDGYVQPELLQSIEKEGVLLYEKN